MLTCAVNSNLDHELTALLPKACWISYCSVNLICLHSKINNYIGYILFYFVYTVNSTIPDPQCRSILPDTIQTVLQASGAKSTSSKYNKAFEQWSKWVRNRQSWRWNGGEGVFSQKQNLTPLRKSHFSECTVFSAYISGCHFDSQRLALCYQIVFEIIKYSMEYLQHN